MIELSIRHSFKNFHFDVTGELPAGIISVFGRSGAGKTTLIKSLAGIIRPDEARIAVQGRVLQDSRARIFLPPHKRRLGLVFQEPRLFPHLTVRSNLCYGRRTADLEPIVEMLGIGALLSRRPRDLSGGEAQRVAIGRALLSAPELLLLDEPLAALDERRKDEILPYIERLRDEAGIPIIYVSHAIREIARLGGTIMVLDEGKLARIGAADDVLSDPDIVPTIGVRDAGASLSGRLLEHHADGLSTISIDRGELLLPRINQSLGTRLRIRIEAQDVILAKSRPEGISALNVLEVELVKLRAGTGPGVIVQLSAGRDKLLARVTRRSAEALALCPGWHGFAIIKSVAVTASDVAKGPAETHRG